MLGRLLYLISFLLVLAGAAGQCFSAVLLDRVVAVVNGEAITWTELYRAMDSEMGRGMKGVTEKKKAAAFKKNERRFLNTLIDKKLQLQEAKKLGISVGEREVDRAMEKIRKKHSLSSKAFMKAIREEGFTEEEYREMLKEQITIGRLLDREVRGRIILSEEEISATLEKENLSDGIIYGISQIVFRLPKGKGLDAVNDKISAVMDGLKAGKSFAELAKRHSEGPAAEKGGDLGYIPREQLAGEFRAALKDLKPGGVSSPFRTGQGVHILMLTGRRDVREILRERAFTGQYRDWLNDLRHKAVLEITLD